MFRVLIVEDEEILRRGIRYAVPWEQHGCAVVGEAHNGVEGKQQIVALDPDNVLTDINMPVMDGITALEAIRAGRAGDPALPVIALTASAMAGDRERFLGMGFDDHLGKPVKPMDLITAIVRAVNPEPPDEDRQAA